ncbi:MAG: putative ABC transport system ATP-binding protein [Elusimicrobia bacterium]|nr:MAG: putative ABC transport system ATP-binding protein [Elusimicrobiota bacterium]KAF0157140.1 MAG: putative ABC transport system ATP-binding protein [Elusimicrobiota bacterium]
MIRCRDLEKIYEGGKAGWPALCGVSFSITPGESVAVTGPSGCGKSTLLNIIGLLDEPSGGGYEFDGLDAARMSDGERSAARLHRIGFVFQAFHLLNRLPAVENVCLPMMYAGETSEGMRRRAHELLARVGLKGKERKTPLELSGGERQRVAIARALANSPKLLLADEPTGNLDSASSREIMDILFGLVGEGMTVIIVTHDRELAVRAGRNIKMRDGKIESI